MQAESFNRYLAETKSKATIQDFDHCEEVEQFKKPLHQVLRPIDWSMLESLRVAFQKKEPSQKIDIAIVGRQKKRYAQ